MPDDTPDPADADVDIDALDTGGTGSNESDESDDDASEEQIPAETVDEAERLTRLAREATVDAEAEAYRDDRERLLADHEYTARVREDETRDVLVLHPAEWIEDGTIRTERIDDVDRGIEVPLSGPGEADDWDVVDEHNREIAAAVREEHGDVHGDNADALADYMSNHYAKAIDAATREELELFLEEYFRRNAWPTDEQREAVEKSVRLAFDAAGERCPLE